MTAAARAKPPRPVPADYDTLTAWMRAEVGTAIKRRRVQAKLTAAALAELCQVGPGQVFRWEAGDNELTFAGLARVADALTCQIGDLFPPTTAIIKARRDLDKDD
jgi:transcriptional regulator with XRE-family HTH domain